MDDLIYMVILEKEIDRLLQVCVIQFVRDGTWLRSTVIVPKTEQQSLGLCLLLKTKYSNHMQCFPLCHSPTTCSTSM